MYYPNNQASIRPTQPQRPNSNVVSLQNGNNLSTGNSPMVLVNRSPVMLSNRTQLENTPFSPQLNNQTQMYHMGGPGSVSTTSQQLLPRSQLPMMMPAVPHNTSQQQQQSPAMGQHMQSVQHPMSNNTSSMVKPNTPQQQQLYQQHLQTSSMSQCSPYLTQVHSNYSSHNSNAPSSNVQIENPSSVPAPNSVPSTTGSLMQQQILASQQQTHAITSLQQLQNAGFHAIETDPIATLKLLILKDLRKTLMDVNLAAERVSQRVLGSGSMTANSVSIGDDKRSMAPQFNLQNPLSAMNPMSVNAPNSVKSINDVKMSSSQGDISAHAGNSDVNGNPLDIYNNAVNNFLNTCDDIEKNLQVIVEVNRRMQHFEGTCSLRTPSDMANLGFPQLQQHYVELMHNNKRSLSLEINRITQLQNRFRNSMSAKRPAAMIIPTVDDNNFSGESDNKKSRNAGNSLLTLQLVAHNCKQEYEF